MLQIKLKPGQQIDIGDDVQITVALDSSRKLTLRIKAPRDQSISWTEPGSFADSDRKGPSRNI